MHINSLSSSEKTAFRSLNKPIEPFKIPTEKGTLHVREYDCDSYELNQKLPELTNFMCENYGKHSNHKNWTQLWYVIKNDPQFAEQFKKYAPSSFAHVFKCDNSKKEDGNSTVLIATDNRNDIKAIATGGTLNKNENLSDDKTYVIENLIVDAEYKNDKVGKTLLNKLLSTTDGENYTDAIVDSFTPATDFYKANGFLSVMYDNKATRTVQEKFVKADEGATQKRLLEKRLDETATHWWQRIADKIK